MIPWLLDRHRGAARLLGLATAVVLFVVVAHLAQIRLSAFRHTGLVFAVYAAILVAAATFAALLTPPVIRLWTAALRVLGDPTPTAAVLLLSLLSGAATAWWLVAGGPAVVGAPGVALLALGALGTLSRRRTSATARRR